MLYHPDENDLIEYAAGGVDWAVGICISTHLHYCPACRLKLNELNALGGHCMESAPAAGLNNVNLMNTMAKIKAAKAGLDAEKNKMIPSTSEPQGSTYNSLPTVLKKVIKNPKSIKWSTVTPSLRSAHLVTEQNKFEVCLHKIKKGGKVAEHDHRGLEVTVVLEGSFSDEKGTYNPGDYIIKKPGDTHRPTAALNKDCICLSIVEAPVKLTGLLGAVVNPFLSVNPQ